jgi:hypothetical protein
LAIRQKKTKYPPDMKLRKVEALAYLNCGGTTLDNYIRAGKIAHVDVSASDPRIRFYLVSDLDRMKSQLGSRAGRRLKGPAAVAIEAIANALPDVPASSSIDLTPIGELDTTQARLMEAVGIPGTVSLHKGQQLLRQHVLLKAIKSKAVDVLFAGLDNLDARIQQQSVKTIFSLILPQLKTVESIKIENPEDTDRAEKLRSDINRLHERIKQLKLTPPTVTMEGVRVIDVD